MVNLEDLTKPQLIKIIKAYNKEVNIAYTNKTKQELIEIIKYFMNVYEGYIETKPKKIVMEKKKPKKVKDPLKELIGQRGLLRGEIDKLKSEIEELNEELKYDMKLKNNKKFVEKYKQKVNDANKLINKLKEVNKQISKLEPSKPKAPERDLKKELEELLSKQKQQEERDIKQKKEFEEIEKKFKEASKVKPKAKPKAETKDIKLNKEQKKIYDKLLEAKNNNIEYNKIEKQLDKLYEEDEESPKIQKLENKRDEIEDKRLDIVLIENQLKLLISKYNSDILMIGIINYLVKNNISFEKIIENYKNIHEIMYDYNELNKENDRDIDIPYLFDNGLDFDGLETSENYDASFIESQYELLIEELQKAKKKGGMMTSKLKNYNKNENQYSSNEAIRQALDKVFPRMTPAQKQQLNTHHLSVPPERRNIGRLIQKGRELGIPEAQDYYLEDDPTV